MFPLRAANSQRSARLGAQNFFTGVHGEQEASMNMRASGVLMMSNIAHSKHRIS
jgi:hypothetical protein